MVKIKVIAIGRDKDAWVSEGCRHYTKLLNRFARLEWELIDSLKLSRSLNPGEIQAAEAAAIRKVCGKATTIALCDKGQSLDSPAFADFLRKRQNESSRMEFLIGGPYGLGPQLIADADYSVSLSPLTFSHQLVRLVLAEQLYRGFAILAGTDYHK